MSFYVSKSRSQLATHWRYGNEHRLSRKIRPRAWSVGPRQRPSKNKRKQATGSRQGESGSISCATAPLLLRCNIPPFKLIAVFAYGYRTTSMYALAAVCKYLIQPSDHGRVSRRERSFVCMLVLNKSCECMAGIYQLAGASSSSKKSQHRGPT
eukprot:6177708-Pleurochrysis_carterae.AAC.2